MRGKCYECKHRGNEPGDCHSSCHHPIVLEAGLGDPLVAFCFLLQGGGQKLAEMEIEADPHGINNGWFMWPWNFDPVWLKNCGGFEKNE